MKNLRYIAPIVVGILMLALWQLAVTLLDVPPYLVPGPILVLQTLVQDADLLTHSLIFTLRITALALFFSLLFGVAIAFLFAQSRIIEASLFPYAVLLQVTPVVAIAPLIIIWAHDVTPALRKEVTMRSTAAASSPGCTAASIRKRSCCGCACPAPCPGSLPGCAFQEGWR